MTDDFEQRARAAARRVNDEARRVAHERRVTSRTDDVDSSVRSRWLAVAAATLTVAGAASLLVVASTRDRTPTATPQETIASSPTTATSALTTSTSPTIGDSSTPTSAPAASASLLPADVPFVAFEDGTCKTQSIGWISPEGQNPWNAFSRGTEAGVPVQVIADPSSGAAGPFAVVLRYFEPTRPAAGATPTEINGNEVFISVYDPAGGATGIGNGEAVWDLPDGSQGYLRSRGLDRPDIESIVTSLIPRPIEAPMPGFDYDPAQTQPERLSSVAVQTNDDVFASSYGIQCLTADSGTTPIIAPVAVVADHGIAPYAIAIDRHRPAWIIRTDEAVLIGGIEQRSGIDPPSDALTTITPQQWQELWSPNGNTQSMAGITTGDAMPVWLGGIGQSGDDLIEILVTRTAPDRLHLDFAATAFHSEAATVELRVDGQLVASTPISAGSLDNDAGIGDSRATIDIRILDNNGHVVHQSGPTNLPPLSTDPDGAPDEIGSTLPDPTMYRPEATEAGGEVSAEIRSTTEAALEPSTVRFRLVQYTDSPFLETTITDLADGTDVSMWQLHIDGRLRSKFTYPGGTHGSRVSPEQYDNGVTVTLTATDASGNVILTTADVSVPAP